MDLLKIFRAREGYTSSRLTASLPALAELLHSPRIDRNTAPTRTCQAARQQGYLVALELHCTTFQAEDQLRHGTKHVAFGKILGREWLWLWRSGEYERGRPGRSGHGRCFVQSAGLTTAESVPPESRPPSPSHVPRPHQQDSLLEYRKPWLACNRPGATEVADNRRQCRVGSAESIL